MAAYPSLPLRASIKPAAPLRHAVGADGGVSGLSLGEAAHYALTITHPLLSAAERDTLLNFYAANKTSLATISPGDGRTYDCVMLSEPRVDVVSAARFTLVTELVGVVV